jgi:hypothetical protein
MDKNPLNIDERLKALVQSLELMAGMRKDREIAFDKRQAEIDKRMAETDKRMKRLGKYLRAVST